MSAGAPNPYVRPAARTDGSAPDPSGVFRIGGPGRYAVPDIPESTDPEYTNGFSPQLATRGSSDGTMLPDNIRIGTREPPENDPNDREYNARRYSEFHKRHSVETTTVGWKVQQHKVPAGQNPLWTQERLPTRPTATDAPAGYMFTRPWHIPRNIKDAVGEDAVAHLSMADHRRDYEIFGMQPQGGIGVNTFRPSVRPWDDNLYLPPRAADSAERFGNPGSFGARFRLSGGPNG
jgi:hypothetical protein